MRELPILFSTEMVKALLDGRKTMTRRIVKPQPLRMDVATTKSEGRPVMIYDPTNSPHEGWSCVSPACPFGIEGDLLWVREKHKVATDANKNFIVTYSDGTIRKVYYKELSLNTVKRLTKRKSINKYVWVQGMFMPKELARIVLQNEGYRIERLQDITEEDAIAEGCKHAHDWKQPGVKVEKIADGSFIAHNTKSFRRGYFLLWDSINGEGSYSSNPWVWVIKFKVLSTTGKPVTKQETEVPHV